MESMLFLAKWSLELKSWKKWKSVDRKLELQRRKCRYIRVASWNKLSNKWNFQLTNNNFLCCESMKPIKLDFQSEHFSGLLRDAKCGVFISFLLAHNLLANKLSPPLGCLLWLDCCTLTIAVTKRRNFMALHKRSPTIFSEPSPETRRIYVHHSISCFRVFRVLCLQKSCFRNRKRSDWTIIDGIFFMVHSKHRKAGERTVNAAAAATLEFFCRQSALSITHCNVIAF